MRQAADLAAKLTGLVLLGTAVWLWFWRSEGWAAFYLLVFAALALLEGGKWMVRRNRGKAPDGQVQP